MALRCLVVEDQRMLRHLLVGMLQRHPAIEVVASVGTVEQAIAACSAHHPDLLILDIALPDGDGFSVAHALRALKPEARTIVLSGFASTVERPPDLRDMITAILDKSRAYEELLSAVECLLPQEAHTLRLMDSLSNLTEREYEVLRLIGAGYTSRAIAAELSIAVRTVETHRRNISGKLGITGAALVHQATVLGQLLSGKPYDWGNKAG